MAIIIPSKHIYPPIDNQKVIDNQVDKIEVQTYAPQIISATENVYNETVLSSGEDGATQKGEIAGRGVRTFPPTSSKHNDTLYVAYIEETPIYLTKTFTIPKALENASVLRIFTGEDKNGQANIKYSLRGNVFNGISHGNITATYTSGGSATNDFNFSSLLVGKPTDIMLQEEDISYTLSKEITDIEYTSPYLSGSAISVTAEFSIQDDSNILTAKATPIDIGYKITLKILGGVKITKLGGSERHDNSSVNTYIMPLSGEYIEYIPTQVDMSFYGDVITLDLQEDILTINKNGKYIMSFSGNELMQSTNTPSIEETYSEIIEECRNGKEVATIRCGIEDYYDKTENDIAITVLGGSQKTVRITADKPLQIGDKIYLFHEYGTTILLVKYVSHNGYECEELEGQADGDMFGKFVRETKSISKKGENGLPMTIQIGNIVIPYKYGANNKDKPMSLKPNGEPKEFRVIGKKTIYDGAIWQELTLQEKTK